ncbi:hypothetical protein [Streptomyces sp. WG-D5]
MRTKIAKTAAVAALTCAAALPLVGTAQAATPAQNTSATVSSAPADDGPYWHHHHDYWDHHHGVGVGLGLGLGVIL